MAALEATDSTLATSQNSNAVFKPKLTVSTNVVYDSITATNESGEEITYTPKYFGKDGGYLFAIVVKNVPVDLATLTVKFTAKTNEAALISTGTHEMYYFTN